MKKNSLGRTDLEISMLGIGGFHLIESPQSEVNLILNQYLEAGGNYIETAESYGDGISEEKIGKAVSGKRDKYILATKTTARTKKEALKALNGSLKRLKTEYVDIWYMHAVQSEKDSNMILSPGGAMEAVEAAKRTGKVRYVGITGHGKPVGLLKAIKDFDYEVLMTGFNYFDRFNFPEIESQLIPMCKEKGTGIIAMKVLADGYLYRNHEKAIRYVMSLPITSIVLGINTLSYLERDMKIIQEENALTDEEKETLFKESPELGNYVCRLCGKCVTDGKNQSDIFNPMEIFLLEGLYDRQMSNYTVPDPAQYALRERLRFWFDQRNSAIEAYKKLKNRVDPEKDYSYLNEKCPYGIDIERKLKIAHAKLTGRESTI